ncbi:MAG: AI-2E family transporter [Epsilonproteobacteria bacterium]|nr:AI-2E family transporter [Campylobacterota bacterium]
MKEGQLGYYFIVMASVIIVLAGVKFASVIIVPFLLSLFIAIILSPIYNFFRSKHIPDILAITIVMILFLFFLALIAKLIGSSVHQFSANIDLYADKLSLYYEDFAKFLQGFGIEIPASEISSLINSKEIMRFSTAIIEGISSIFKNGFIVILTVVFMLLESQHFIAKIEATDKEKATIKHINQIFSQIKSYMVIKALISAVTGFIIYLSLSFIGTDYAFLWGMLAFLLNFIPNIGSIIAAVPAVLITLVQLGGVSVLLVSALYLIANVVIGSIVEPKVMGKGLGLSTLVVFISLIFWGWLLGLVGMLLSIPLTIMAKIVFAANENTKWIAILLGSDENLQENKLLTKVRKIKEQ